MTQVHENIKPIQCHQCSIKFGFNSELKRHYEKVHGGKVPNSQDEYTYQKVKDMNNHNAFAQFNADLPTVNEGKEPIIQDQISYSNQDISEMILPD